MNYPDPQSVTDTQWRRCEDCGTELAPGTDHGDAECRDVLADKAVYLRSELRRVRDELRAFTTRRHEESLSLRRELAAEQTWAARLEGALGQHDCKLLGEMRRKYRGGADVPVEVGDGR